MFIDFYKINSPAKKEKKKKFHRFYAGRYITVLFRFETRTKLQYLLGKKKKKRFYWRSYNSETHRVWPRYLKYSFILVTFPVMEKWTGRVTLKSTLKKINYTCKYNIDFAIQAIRFVPSYRYSSKSCIPIFEKERKKKKIERSTTFIN